MLFWLRFHPVVYWLAGLAIVGLAVFAYTDTVAENEARAAALSAGPPEEKRLEDFDPMRDANAAKEVVVLAVLETSALYTLTKTNDGTVTRETWVAPLRPSTGGDSPEIRAVLVEKDEKIPGEQISRWVVGEAGEKPIIRVHGVVSYLIKEDREEMEKVFSKQGLTVSEKIVVLDPFLKPREVELKQVDPIAIVSLIGGVGGLVFVYGFFRRWRRRRAAAAM